MLTLAASFLIAFLAGSFPTAYWAGRVLKNTDIREHGSGNVGATNAFRVLGKKTGTAVLLVDFAKGLLPVLVLPAFFDQNRLTAHEFYLWIGFGAILGHMFTPFLGFKGGKGIATGAGVLCAGFPLVFLLTLTVWGATFMIWRVVSVSSILAVSSMVGFSLLLGESPSVVMTFFGIAVLLIWAHRSNIRRLLKGEGH